MTGRKLIDNYATCVWIVYFWHMLLYSLVGGYQRLLRHFSPSSGYEVLNICLRKSLM